MDTNICADRAFDIGDRGSEDMCAIVHVIVFGIGKVHQDGEFCF